VATAVGGLTDTVVDGMTGDLVPPRDPQALGAALRRLLGDQVRRMSYGAAALDRAVSAYAWPHVAARLAAIYAEVTATTSIPQEAVA
jgi:glycosyltransferase involved in cell wall biosynthesis